MSTKSVVTMVICIVTVAMYTGSAFWSVCIDDAIVVFHTSNVIAQLGEYTDVSHFAFFDPVQVHRFS